MKPRFTVHCLRFLAPLLFACVGMVVPRVSAAAPFIIQLGGDQTGSLPVPLVSHGDEWRYHKGTTAPVVGWQTNAEATLDGTWLTGRGGFGYSTDTPNEVALCQTILGDMFGLYTTLYVRRTFEVTNSYDASRHLVLTLDYDDGFVAYLDGREVARDRARTAIDVEPPSTDTSSSNHESSRGTSAPVNPPSTIDLGPIGSRLQPGLHTLAILCLNGAPSSSDLVMIPDLAVAPPAGSLITGPLLAVTGSSSILVSGTNTIPGAAQITINGAAASFDSGTAAWSRTQPLVPGCNQLIVEALAASGAVLFSTNQVVVSEPVSTNVTSLDLHTTWTPAMGVIHVPGSLTIPSGGSLTVAAGTTVLLGPGVSLLATTDASLTVDGTAENPVCLLTADGLTMWGELAADGANSALTIRHAETIGGAIKGRNGALCLLEDSYFHDYKNGSVPIGGCTSARSMTVRRCHFRIYHETLWQNTLMTVEDNLFELANNPSSDALDFDGAVVGSVIRHCTFRHGPQSNTDAVDIGPTTSGSGSTNTLITDCLMFDFPNDKGVSIGEGSYGIVVTNCLMYGNDSGVSVKDSPGGKPPCTANIIGCTIVDNDYGFRCYNKSNPSSPTNGGQITNSYNNIIWSSRIAVAEILNAGFVIADHTDLNGTNSLPLGFMLGEGGMEADPLFANAALRDYRLLPNSPCVGAGRNGATLGVHYPVGSMMAPSHPYFSQVQVTNGAVRLGFWVDSEKDYTVLASASAADGTWTKLTDVYHQMRPRYVQVSDSVGQSGTRFYRLVSPALP